MKNMKNKATTLMLSVFLGLGLFSISDTSQAWYRNGYWGGYGWHGGYWRGYNRGWYGYRRCGWINGHWRNGYWIPGHRACW